jgi:hypothetical protein
MRRGKRGSRGVATTGCAWEVQGDVEGKNVVRAGHMR